MSRLNKFFLLGIISNFLVSNVYAVDDTTVIESSPTVKTTLAAQQGQENYKVLTAPPDFNKPPEQWLVYFGPTKEQAEKNKAAASKRRYVETHSPLKAIPDIREERPVTWITLTPDKQITLKRSSSSISTGTRVQPSDYGY